MKSSSSISGKILKKSEDDISLKGVNYVYNYNDNSYIVILTLLLMMQQ